MKTGNYLLTALILAVWATPASATIWRVDNNAGNQADFTTLQAAHDTSIVAAGDTLYVTGSGASYGALTLTKKLIIFGPGYLLVENPEVNGNLTPAPAQATTIIFQTGSEGSMLIGLSIGDIDIYASNITIKRNYINSISPGNAINILSNASNIIITQCYVLGYYFSTSADGIELVGNNSNIIISNNYISPRNSSANSILAPSNSSLSVKNNVFGGHLEISNSDIRNNIKTSTTFTGTGNTIFNNIGNSTQFGSANGNQENVDMATVFEGTGSTDGQWKLKAGSPAIGAADDGGDVGMYGGDEPYVLSGVPHLPSISFLKVPTTGSKALGLPVQIKVRGNN